MKLRTGITMCVLVALLPLCGCTSSSHDEASRQGTILAGESRTDDRRPPGLLPDGIGESEAEYANTLRWTTASEVNNFGFDIYRATDVDGPFEKITAEPLAGAGTTDEPHSYVYIDNTIDPTRGYYYYIESISMAGVRERFSPIVHIGPKKPPAESDR